MKAIWPQYNFLGEYHTHPYGSLDDVKGNKGWRPSPADEINFSKPNSVWRKYSVMASLIVAVTELGRTTSSLWSLTEQGQTLEITLGKYRLWISGYVAYWKNGTMMLSSADEDAPPVTVKLPFVTGIFEKINIPAVGKN